MMGAGRQAAAGAKPFHPKVTVTATTTLGSGGTPDWWGRASIKRRTSDNALVMLYRRGSAHDVNDGALYIKFSDDDGASWSAENTTLGGAAVTGFPMNPSTLSAGQDAGEPILYVAPNGDLVCHMWRIDYSVSMGGTYQARSTDGGNSWAASAAVTFNNTAEDQSTIFATDDDFVLSGTTYAGARVYSGGADGIPSKSLLIKNTTSDLAIDSWDVVSVIMDETEGDTPNGGGQEVGLEYIGNNTILAMIRDNPQTKSFRRYSTDLGATWGTLEDATSVVGIAGRQRIYTLAHLRGEANWWTDPEMLMCGFGHTVPGNSQGRGVTVWYSPDHGNRWWSQGMDTQTSDGGYGDLFAKADGTFGLVSYTGVLTAASLKQYDFTLTT